MSRSIVFLLALSACEGPAGPKGAAGDDGVNGQDAIACWDLNENGAPGDLEDVNDDGVVDARDCRGQDGDPGDDGSEGTPGTDCWDTNGNGQPDPGEDLNGDGLFNALDCVGDDGTNGETLKTFDTDTTWAADMVIDGVWYVESGVTLTITTGVTVSLMPGAGLVVDGTLITSGNASNPTVFETAYNSSGADYGIRVSGTGDGSKLDHVRFDGVSLFLDNLSTPSIDGGTFTDASLVVTRRPSFAATGLDMSENLLRPAQGLVVREVDTLTVTDSSFTEVTDAIVWEGRSDAASGTVQNSDFSNVANGIVVGGFGTFEHTLAVDGVTIDTTQLRGILAANTTATISGLVVNGALVDGISADANSAVTITNATFDGGSNAVDVGGDLTMSQVTITDCTSTGVLHSSGNLTITNSSILRPRGAAVNSVGTATLTGVTIADPFDSGVVLADGALVLDNVQIDRPLGSAVVVNDANLNATNLRISSAGSTAIAVRHGDITGTTLDITDTDGTGISVSDGSMDVTDVTVSGAVGTGLFSNDGHITVRGTSLIEGVLGTSVSSSRGDLHIIGDSTGLVTVKDGAGVGLFALTGNMSIENALVENMFGIGINQNGTGPTPAVTTITNTTVRDTESSGIQVALTDLMLDNVTVSGTRGHGIFNSSGAISGQDISVDTTGQYGLFASNPPAGTSMALTRVEISDTAGRGIDIRQPVDLSQIRTNRVGDDAIFVPTGSVISACTLVDTGDRGIQIQAGPLATLITGCDVSGSGSYGIFGDSVSPNLIDLLNSNLVGNGFFAARYLQLMDGNYVADNNGAIGVDTTTGGTIDDVRDTSGTQTRNMDAIRNAASAPLTGIGATF